MPALAQCDAFAYIYDQAGDPAPDVLVVLKRVLDASGNPILLGPKTTTTDSAGSFHFTLPEFATAFISARASALWNCPDGRAFKVPLGPSGELVPDFSLPPSTLVEPPLVYVGDVLSIPKASETQDGYLSAADYVAFLAAAGADVGVTQINTGIGLTGGPITGTGTISHVTISGVAGTYPNPTSITVNAQGHIIAITSGAPDTTPPVITGVNVPTLGSTSVTIGWHTNEPADSQVDYGPTTSYGSSTTLDTAPALDHSVSITGLTSNAPYHFQVKSRDTASNLATSGDFTFTTAILPDTTAPGISAVMATSVSDTEATITWTTNELADSQVVYGTTTSYGTSFPVSPADTSPRVLSHTVILTGLTPLTPYHYHVRSIDGSTNAGDSLTSVGDLSFTTTAGASVDLITGLLSYWKLDTGSGGSPDVLGSSNFGVYGPLSFSTAGKYGNRCDSPGGIGTVLGAADNVTQHFTGSFSVAGWLVIKVSDGTQIHTLLARGDPFSAWSWVVSYNEYVSSFDFGVTTDGANTGRHAVDISMAVVVDAYYFLAAVYDASVPELRFSINNATPVVTPFSGTIFPTTSGLTSIAAGGTTSAICAVDEIGLWTKALTAGEITALYNGGAGKTHPFT